MLSFFQFEETWDSLKQHKNRNILTGFGVAWGIFILVLLVGAGNGLQKGIMMLFQDYTQNCIWIYGGQTSMSKPSQRSGRTIDFSLYDLDIIEKRFQEISYLSPEVFHNGKLIYTSKTNYKKFKCIGVTDNYFNIKTYKTSKGRLINYIDNQIHAKVAVVGEEISKALFGKDDPIGKYFCLDGIWLQIIGILSEKSLFTNNQREIYIPFNTLQNYFQKQNRIDCFAISLNKSTNPEKFEKELKSYLAKIFQFHEKDKNALYIENLQANAKAFKGLFKSIQLFLWIVGICMLLSGIVGVSNIMLVVVKERTQEIGIRKAIGAPPKSILFMILNESVIITLLSGLIGLLSASGLVFILNAAMNSMISDKNSIFKGLDMNIPVAIGALFLLVVAGAIAGVYPARKAAEVTPIKALNSDNL